MQRGSDHLGVQGRRRNNLTIFDSRFIKPSQILQLTWKSLTTYFGLGSLTISKPYKLKICPFGLTNTYLEWSTVISETIVIEKGKENVNQPISRICRKKLIATFLGASSEAKAKSLNVAKSFAIYFELCKSDQTAFSRLEWEAINRQSPKYFSIFHMCYFPISNLNL